MRKENETLQKQETSLLALLFVSLSLLACSYSFRISWDDICPKCLKCLIAGTTSFILIHYPTLSEKFLTRWIEVASDRLPCLRKQERIPHICPARHIRTSSKRMNLT